MRVLEGVCGTGPARRASQAPAGSLRMDDRPTSSSSTQRRPPSSLSLALPSWSLEADLGWHHFLSGYQNIQKFQKGGLCLKPATSGPWVRAGGQGVSALPGLLLPPCSMRNVSSEIHQLSSWPWFTEGLCPDPRAPLKLPLSGMV